MSSTAGISEAQVDGKASGFSTDDETPCNEAKTPLRGNGKSEERKDSQIQQNIFKGADGDETKVGKPTDSIEVGGMEESNIGERDKDNRLISAETVKKSGQAKSNRRRDRKKRTVMKMDDEDSILSEGDGKDLDDGLEGERRQSRRRRRPRSESHPNDDDGAEEEDPDPGSDFSDVSYDTEEEEDDEEYLRKKAKVQAIKEKKLLTNAPGLQAIELGEESLIRHSPKDLTKAIRRNRHVQKLVLNEKNCDPVGFEILIEGLDKNESIVQLELRQANVTKDVAVELYTALSHNTTVKKFCMKRCTFAESGLAVLFVGFQHCKSIKHLSIESCDLGEETSHIVAAAIPLMNLQSIRIQNTKTSERGMRFFLASMAKTNTLESINISEEKISEKAMAKLLFGIQKCTNLVRLVFFDCGLDEVSIELLAEAIEGNEKLQSINVSKNEFGNEGADILIDLLKSNNAIKSLKCDGCRISRHEKRLLKDALRYNSTFLKSLFSPEVTLSILDSVGLFEKNPMQKS